MPTIAIATGTSRTAKYLIPEGMAKGYRVKAIVRSAKRFEAMVQRHQHEGLDWNLLSVHRLADFNDAEQMAAVLRDVDVVYVTASTGVNQPTTVAQDVVIAVVAGIRAAQQQHEPYKKIASPKVVLLSAAPISPVSPVSKYARQQRRPQGDVTGEGGGAKKDRREADQEDGSQVNSEEAFEPIATKEATTPEFVLRLLRNHLVNYGYDDLERAQNYLEMQSGWLDWCVVSSSMIVDVVESSEEIRKWKFSTTKLPSAPMSYARLADAMLSVADCSNSGQWDKKGLFLMPHATSTFKITYADCESRNATIKFFLVHRIAWPAVKVLAVLTAGIGVGIGIGYGIARG